MSDEYGPHIYRFSPSGHLLQAIQPPNAFLPFIGGTLNFASETDPDTGRAANQGASCLPIYAHFFDIKSTGFEGLTASPDGNTLYALLQSATIQDGGSSKSTSRFTRMLAYDVSDW